MSTLSVAGASSPKTLQLVEVPVLLRSLSRSHLSPRNPGGPIHVSSRANSVLKGGEPPYYVGLRKVSEDPYDELGNPDGVIQLGLDENKLTLDLVRDWLVENAREAILGGEELGISGIACYQPFDGLLELKLGIVSMAPGSSAQKRKKELEARRERKAAKAAARLGEAAANETAIPEPAVSIPGLEDTNFRE